MQPRRQCDHVARLFVKYFTIFKICPIGQCRFNFLPNTNKFPQKIGQRCLHFARVANF